MTDASTSNPRLLAERPMAGDATGPTRKRPARSVTVNLAESPLGWLFARGHVSRRQYDAGERLRMDWERGQLSPRVTMAWDAAPVARSRGGSAQWLDLNGNSTRVGDLKRRSQWPDLAWPTYYGESSAPARVCAMPKRRSAGQRGPASWYLGSRSTGSPIITG